MDHQQRLDVAIDKLPPIVALIVIDDINTRITDWLSSGGEEGDQYLEQQVRYAENVAKKYETDEENAE